MVSEGTRLLERLVWWKSFEFDFCWFHIVFEEKIRSGSIFLAGMADDGKDSNSGAWARVPTWDGSPQTWRSFRKEMNWWLAGLDLQSTKKYNLAARWLLRQSGVVRQRGEEYEPHELAYQQEVRMPNPTTGDEEVVTPEDPLSGINKLLRSLEEMTGRTSLDKRGELRNVFYLELRRKSGERISEFATRYRSLVAELKIEGVVIGDGELGWWFKHKLGLDPLSAQLLETALAGAEDYPTIEREVLRLFKDLHVADPLHRRGGEGEQRAPLLNRFLSQQATTSRASSYAPSMASSTGRSLRSGSSTASSGRFNSSSAYRKPFVQKQVMVSEAEEDEMAAEIAQEAHEPDPEGDSPSLEEVLTTEAEVLAAELDEAAANGVDDDTLREIEDSVEAAAEAFLTMKEAGTKLQEVRKDRGYGKAPNPTATSPTSKVNLKKQSDRHPCFDCGLPGHWAGDAECQKPGQQLGRKKGKATLKQVKVTEALNTEHEEVATDGHEVLMVQRQSPVLSDAFLETVQNFHEPKEVNALGLAVDKRLMGALDSACNRTCTGSDWLHSFLTVLRATAPKEVVDLVRSEPEHETFRFGNGGTQVSNERWRLPTVVGGGIICFWTSVVPVASLGLLLGRDFLEAVGAVMDFSRRALRCDHLDGIETPLNQLAAGHYALRLLPDRWRGLGAQKWRRFGLDGIVEVQFSFKQWIRRRLKLPDVAFHESFSDSHDHFLTENSVRAGHLVCTALSPLSSGSVQATSMPRPTRGSVFTSTSPTTRTTPRTSTRHGEPLKGAARTSCDDHGSDSVAEVCPSRARKVQLGRERSALVGPAKALLAVLTATLSLYGNGRHVVAPRSATSQGWSWMPEAPRHGLHHGQVHLPEFERMHPLAKPPWTSNVLLRGPDRDGHDSWQDGKRPAEQGEECRVARSSARGQRSRSCRNQGGAGESPDRTPWRFAAASRGFDQAGDLVERGREGRRQRGDHQEQGATYRQPAQGIGGFREGQGQGQAGSKESSRLDRGLRRRHQDRAIPWHGLLPAPDRHERSIPTHSGQYGTGDSRAPQSTRASGDGRFDQPGISECYVSTGCSGPRAPSGRSLVAGGSIRTAADGSVRGQHRMADPGGETSSAGSLNPYKLHQGLKPGQANLIAQAWDRHVADRLRISQEPKKVQQILEAEYFKEMNDFMNEETFVQTIDLMPKLSEACQNEHVDRSAKQPLVTEVYTTAQNITKEAQRRGHKVGAALSLETGWNFLLQEHRDLARKRVVKEKPFLLVLAFPCGPFSPLQHLNARGRRTWPQRLEDGRTLMRFALELATLQLEGGRHCLLENPKPSAAWKEPEMRKFIEENNVFEANFDQCRFGLRNASGDLHRKATLVVSSSSDVLDQLDGMVCKRDHFHAPVIGGSKVTAQAGIYPMSLARAIVKGIELQFDRQHKPKEVNALEPIAEGEEDDTAATGGAFGVREESDDDELAETPAEKNMTIPAAVKLAVKRLHENTGHRSGKRLARALTIAGAPVEAIVAAKRHRCQVCQERAPPKSRRPASLPSPKDLGDQVHLDLLEVEDAAENKYFVAHCTDFATRFQAAEILPNKSTQAVIQFMTKRWVAMFGPPRVLVCDQGREFISWEMEEWASSMSSMLHHIAVQAPWQNGVAEKSGGALKTIVAAIVTAKSIVAREEMEMALAEAIAAYNGDVDGESGCSPFQAALGQQPRMVGDVLGGIQQRLGEHGLVESKPSFARQIAMRETAKLAMTRLHFSRGLRKAELARSRSSTIESAPTPGTICYFYRPLRYNNKMSQSRKKLTLKRWHGPAMLVAMDGHASAFLSYKGQLTKCALEHVRPASTMEQIASGAWEEAIKEAVEDARHEMALRKHQEVHEEPPSRVQGELPLQVLPETPAEVENPKTPAFLPSSSAPLNVDENQSGGGDLPPVQPKEFWQMMVPSSSPAPSQVDSTLPSRRGSDFSETPFPETTRWAMSRKSSGAPLETVRERARMMDAQAEAGVKRPAEVDADILRDQDRHGHEPEASSTSEALVMERSLRREIQEELNLTNLHPLRRAHLQACLDKIDPLEALVNDHGTWHGKWSLPSRSVWQTHERLGIPWPTGDQPDHEVDVVQANRKEFRWRTMSEAEKLAFTEAARQAWAVWEENDAIEVLTPEESSRIRRRLMSNREGSKILTPRYVFTDRHEGLRTLQNPLPLKARARVIVPGYKDVFSYSLRKDAPTGSRVSQHMLFTYTASNAHPGVKASERWRIMSADVKSAFLKGDAYVDGQRELFLENAKGDEPKLPFGNSLARIRKGVFGLSDAPRQWCLRLNKSLINAGWERTVFDYACWLLWSEDRRVLHGIIISHVDDLLLGGDDRAQKSLLSIGQELGFGSVEYDDFVYCGKRVKMESSGNIVINMKAYHDNLKPVEIPLSRRKTPEAELNDHERRQLRAVLGSLQWLVAQVRFDQGSQRPPQGVQKES